MRAQLVAERQVEPGEHHDLVARSQVFGTLRDLLTEADPRPRRAYDRRFGRSVVAEVARFDLARGCPNTLSNNAGPRSPVSATARELRKHDPGDHR